MRPLVLVLGIVFLLLGSWRLWATGRRARPAGRWYIVVIASACAVAVAALW